MSYKIPTIIPKFRFWGAFIALTISSAIFVSSFTLIFSLNNAGGDIFGTSDNILVYYDTRATTPFTSNVPEYLEKSFRQVAGVELVNPEIFQPVIIGKNTAYIRGTNITNLMDLENGKLTQGKVPDSKQIYHALVGEGLSNRLNLNINDTITIESIVVDQQIPIRIVGKYKSGNLATTDELLVSKEIARAIAGDDEFTVTHIRVKFDPLVTTKEKIINEALKLYTLNLDVNLGNNTGDINNYSIQIIDQANQIVFNNKVERFFEINLFKGTYFVNILKGTSIQSKETIFLDSDVNLLLDLFNYKFKFDAEINYQLVTLPEIKYEIRQMSTGTLQETGFTDINGKIDVILPRDNYSINIFEGTNIITRTFFLDRPLKLKIDIDSFDSISFDNLKNGTLVLKNSFTLTISDLPINLNLIIKNEIIPKSPSVEINKYEFPINLENGVYEFSLIHLENIDKKIKTVILEIDSSILQPQILNFLDGAHYEPSQQLNINTKGLSNGTLKTSIGQLTYLNENITVIELPNKEGFYNLILSALDIFGSEMKSNNILIIENNPTTGGWKKHLSQPIVKIGDKLDVWTNTNYEGMTAQSGSLEFNANKLIYLVPNLPTDNNYSIEIFPQNADTFFLNFTLVPSYSSLFTVSNVSSSTPLETGTIYNSSYITLNYLNQSSISFDRDWEILINMGFGNFSLYSGQNVSIPGVLELIPTKIYLKSKITNSVEVIDVNFQDDPIPQQDYLNLIGGFPSRILDGQIRFITPNGTILNYEILKNSEIYNPVILSNNIIQLSPGNYSVTFTNANYSSLIWNFEVPFAIEADKAIISIDVAYEWGFINNFSGNLDVGSVYINGTNFIVEKTLDLNFNYYKNLLDESIELNLNNFIQGNITIQFSNTTITKIEVTSSVLNYNLNDLTGNTHIEIMISSISLTGNSYEYSDVILLNQTEVEFTFSLNNASKDINLPYRFTLTLYETREIISLNIDEFNTTFTLFILPQINQLTITNINGSLFDGEIDLFSNTNFTYFFGFPTIKFEVYNLNYQSQVLDGVVSISHQGKEDEIEISINKEIQLPIGIYNFILKDGNFETSLILGINRSRNITIPLDIREIKTSIIINGLPIGDFTDFELVHKFLPAIHKQQINVNENVVSIESFPYGPSTLKLNGSWGSNEIELNIIRNIVSIDLVIEGSQNILSNIDFRFADKVANLQLGASVGGEYLDSFLAGSLLIARSILITEIIIIFLIVISNVIEIFAAITYESKREIAVLRNLGSTTFQTVIASTKFLLVNTIVIAVLGQLLGGIVIKILLAGQYTVYFGHQFYPRLFVFEIFLANISIVIFLTFLGAFFNVRKEYKSQ